MYAELARPYVEEVKRNRWMGKLLGLPILSRSAEPGLYVELTIANTRIYLISQTRRQLEEMVARPGFEIPGSPPGPRGPKPRIPSRAFLWPLDDRARNCFYWAGFKLFRYHHPAPGFNTVPADTLAARGIRAPSLK
jgi:hypothetical protein